jgi:hypothetical protein
VIAVSDWVGFLGAAGGLIGAVGGIGGAFVAAAAKRDSRRSAAASERSAEAAERSALAADRSADADTVVAGIEQAQQHRELKPPAPAFIEAFYKGNSLFGKIKVPHDYRVAADGVYGTDASHQIGLPMLLRANQQQEFQIEPWPAGSKEPKTKEIRFRFWPPLESDDAPSWGCPCGEPMGETLDGPGHWEWVVPVVYQRARTRWMGA